MPSGCDLTPTASGGSPGQKEGPRGRAELRQARNCHCNHDNRSSVRPLEAYRGASCRNRTARLSRSALLRAEALLSGWHAGLLARPLLLAGTLLLPGATATELTVRTTRTEARAGALVDWAPRCPTGRRRPRRSRQHWSAPTRQRRSPPSACRSTAGIDRRGGHGRGRGVPGHGVLDLRGRRLRKGTVDDGGGTVNPGGGEPGGVGGHDSRLTATAVTNLWREVSVCWLRRLLGRHGRPDARHHRAPTGKA